MRIIQFWLKSATSSKVAVEIKWQFGETFVFPCACTFNYSSRGDVFSFVSYCYYKSAMVYCKLAADSQHTKCCSSHPNSPTQPWQAIAKATQQRSTLTLLAFCWTLIFQNMFLSKQVGEIISQDMYVWDINASIILFYIPFLFCAIQRVL